MIADDGNSAPSVFWHRDLPPREGEAIGEHTTEAASMRVSGPLAHGDGMWGQCYEDLIASRKRGSNRRSFALAGTTHTCPGSRSTAGTMLRPTKAGCTAGSTTCSIAGRPPTSFDQPIVPITSTVR